MIYEGFNTKDILSLAMAWAKNNDNILYANLHYGYDSYNLSFNLNDKDLMKIVKENLENNSIEDILKEAVNRADYEDIVKLSWTFVSSHKDWNPGDIFDWKYTYNKDNPYSFMNDLINKKKEELRNIDYDDWHKSKDHKKHKHFRFWIKERFLEGKEDKILSLRFFVENDTNCHDTFLMGNNYHDEQMFNSIMQYILDNDICPNKHCKELNVPDFVAQYSMYNTRKITSSGEFGGFWYLVYLTAEELQDIYKNKINKRKLSDNQKARWSYINSLKSDYAKKTKFYLFIK